MDDIMLNSIKEIQFSSLVQKIASYDLVNGIDVMVKN